MCDPLCMSPTLTLPSPPPVVDETPGADLSATANGELLVEESLVDEVSIDGMCGVY